MSAPAQTLENGQTPAGRLEQLVETYSSTLRKYHAPIIQEYLVSLEKLKQTFALRGRSERLVDVRDEIDRVKIISTGSGLLPYETLQAERWEDTLDPARTTGVGSVKPPVEAGRPVRIILAAASARRSTPDVSGLSVKPDGRAVPVGAAEWQIDSLPAGDYRILILYSCAGKFTEPASIVTRLGQISVSQTFTAAHATGGVNEFRIARLGDISIAKSLSGVSLVLSNEDPDVSAIWVRQVIIARREVSLEKVK